MKLHDRLCKVEEAKRDYEEVDEGGHDDDDCVSTVSSCVSSVGDIGDLDVEEDEVVGPEDEEMNWNALSESEKVAKATEALKHLGNIKRKPYNRLAVKDIFEVGNKRLLKTIKKSRRKAIRKQKRRLELVHLAVKYFCRQMKYRRAILNDRINKSNTNGFDFALSDTEVRYKEIMKKRRENGDANVK